MAVAVRLGLVVLLAALAGCGGDRGERADVLVLTRTTAFRHAEAIEAGGAALRERFGAEVTDDASRLEDLDGVRVVVLLQTNGEGVLQGGQRTELERWVRAGGGVVAIHAAANADRDWAFYGELLGGARFRNHAARGLRATVTVRDRDHPATARLPPRWIGIDEWYNFAPEPGPRARVLATVDERDYDEADGSAAADPHPIAWWTPVGRGRALNTARGHGPEAWNDPLYRAHVFGAIHWAGRTR